MDATGPVVSAIQGSKSTLDKTLVLFLSKILKVILLALSVWGSLLGLIGMIIALPLTSLLISYYKRFVLKNEADETGY